MVYRLYNGTYSQMRRYILQAGVVLGLTIGFPALAAYLTREVLVPRPTDIAENDSPGFVMGASSTNAADTPAPAESPAAETAVPTTSNNATVTRSRAGGSTSRTESSMPGDNGSSGQVPSGSSEPLPVGGSGGDPNPNPDPDPDPDPGPTPQEPPIMVELDLLGAAGADLSVDPNEPAVEISVTP